MKRKLPYSEPTCALCVLDSKDVVAASALHATLQDIDAIVIDDFDPLVAPENLE